MDLFFSFFFFERPLLTRDWKSESVTDGPTNQLAWVGARDTCVSKKISMCIFLHSLCKIWHPTESFMWQISGMAPPAYTEDKVWMLLVSNFCIDWFCQNHSEIFQIFQLTPDELIWMKTSKHLLHGVTAFAETSLSDQNIFPVASECISTYISKCISNLDGSNLKLSLRNWIMPSRGDKQK